MPFPSRPPSPSPPPLPLPRKIPASKSLGMRTASRCTPETARGTHTFEIVGYSLHKGLGAGNFIRSAAFAVGGYDWCLRFYPEGDTGGDCEGYVAVYLELLSGKSEVRALCSFELVEVSTGTRWGWEVDSPGLFSTIDMSKEKNSWGQPCFMEIKELEESLYLRNDRLVIECQVAVIKPPRVTETTTVSMAQMPPLDLLGNFKKLLEAGKGVDVTFRVNGEVFAAHKIVLAVRSPVFMAQLYGPVGEENRDCITVEDMQPAVFKALIHFIYTDSLPAMDNLDRGDKNEMVMHLLIAADRYDMERLKLICEGILCESLDVETVATILSLADQHNSTKLKDACIEYMNSSDRMDEVVASQGYQYLKRACPDVIVDIWEKEKATKTRKI
ncbi:hypothetical protein ACP70R_003131 [Stipagrostis hirtigluma subsp. patula]